MKWNINEQVGEKITIATKRGILCFDVERIKYIICEGHYCNIYLIDETNHRVRRSLKFFKQKLGKDKFFHNTRNMLINTRYINDGQFAATKKTIHLKATKTESVPVSKRRVTEFKQFIASPPSSL